MNNPVKCLLVVTVLQIFQTTTIAVAAMSSNDHKTLRRRKDNSKQVNSETVKVLKSLQNEIRTSAQETDTRVNDEPNSVGNEETYKLPKSDFKRFLYEGKRAIFSSITTTIMWISIIVISIVGDYLHFTCRNEQAMLLNDFSMMYAARSNPSLMVSDASKRDYTTQNFFLSKYPLKNLITDTSVGLSEAVCFGISNNNTTITDNGNYANDYFASNDLLKSTVWCRSPVQHLSQSFLLLLFDAVVVQTIKLLLSAISMTDVLTKLLGSYLLRVLALPLNEATVSKNGKELLATPIGLNEALSGTDKGTEALVSSTDGINELIRSCVKFMMILWLFMKMGHGTVSTTCSSDVSKSYANSRNDASNMDAFDFTNFANVMLNPSNLKQNIAVYFIFFSVSMRSFLSLIVWPRLKKVEEEIIATKSTLIPTELTIIGENLEAIKVNATEGKHVKTIVNDLIGNKLHVAEYKKQILRSFKKFTLLSMQYLPILLTFIRAIQTNKLNFFRNIALFWQMSMRFENDKLPHKSGPEN